MNIEQLGVPNDAAPIKVVSALTLSKTPAGEPCLVTGSDVEAWIVAGHLTVLPDDDPAVAEEPQGEPPQVKAGRPLDGAWLGPEDGPGVWVLPEDDPTPD